MKVLTGHTGSVLCLQYDENVIISGSSDSTVRVWDVHSGEMVNTLIHHCEAVLHLRFSNGMMVTCSKVRFSRTDFISIIFQRSLSKIMVSLKFKLEVTQLSPIFSVHFT